MPKFSIIIPAFNVENVIDICLQSIKDQSYSDFEVICVDDGSTDHTLDIIKRYVRYDSRFRSVAQKNLGVSTARNVGIKEATGDYIWLVDSDDWTDKNALSIVDAVTSAENLDCIIFPVTDVFPTKEIRNNQLDPSIAKVGDKTFNYKMVGDDIIYSFGGMQAKILRRKFIIDNEILFNISLKSAEDTCFYLEVLAAAKKIKIINNSLYYYRKKLDGKTLTTQHIREINKSLDYAVSKLSKHFDEAVLIDRFAGSMLYVYNRPDYQKDSESLEILRNAHLKLSQKDKTTRNYKQLEKAVKKNTLIRRLAKSLFQWKGKGKRSIIKIAGIIIDVAKIKFNFKYRKYSIRYQNTLRRIKSKATRGEDIVVLFLFNELSKIKTLSLIDALNRKDGFKVKVAVTTLARIPYYTQQKNILEQISNLFKERGIEVIDAYDKDNGKPLPLPKADFDILFYQQPWQIQGFHSLRVISKSALTMYVPYYVPNYGYINMDCMDFHKLLFRYYVLNDDYLTLYKRAMHPFTRQLKAVGHTELDAYTGPLLKCGESDLVIYAPHWSIGNGTEKYSTFLWNGYFMLEYAKNHPDIKWVFKPHPTLKRELLKKGLLSIEEINAYYEAWHRISIVNESFNYIELFKASKCLITDCGSFLVEYFPTKKPVIRLTSKLSRQPCDPLKRIIKNYYNVSSLDELRQVLNQVLIKNIDPKKKEREEAVEKFTNFNDNFDNSADRIVNDIQSIIFS